MRDEQRVRVVGGGEAAARPGGRRPGSRAIALFALAALLGAGGLVRWSLAPRPEAGRPLDPLRTSTDPRTGERTAAFSGFAVAVETEPQGALVAVAGIERGEAPVLAGVACAPGEEIEIRARAPAGDASARTTCRADTLVKLTLRLRR